MWECDHRRQYAHCSDIIRHHDAAPRARHLAHPAGADPGSSDLTYGRLVNPRARQLEWPGCSESNGHHHVGQSGDQRHRVNLYHYRTSCFDDDRTANDRAARRRRSSGF